MARRRRHRQSRASRGRPRRDRRAMDAAHRAITTDARTDRCMLVHPPQHPASPDRPTSARPTSSWCTEADRTRRRRRRREDGVPHESRDRGLAGELRRVDRLRARLPGAPARPVGHRGRRRRRRCRAGARGGGRCRRRAPRDQGGSAGGWTVLAALARTDAFAAGISRTGSPTPARSPGRTTSSRATSTG